MAGIYIPRIKMPNGGTIKIEIGYDADGHPMAMTEDYNVYDVISISDHGRLGDLDELENRITAWMQTNRRALTEDVEPYVTSLLRGIQTTSTLIPADKEENECVS